MSWDHSLMELASFWASERSKDPSTKVGAVIVDDKNRVIGMGYNGFPRGVKDTPERYANREEKYPRVVHAEVNAILNAVKSVEGCTLYVTHEPCVECVKVIIQSGIKKVVYDKAWERAENNEIAQSMLKEAGVCLSKI